MHAPALFHSLAETITFNGDVSARRSAALCPVSFTPILHPQGAPSLWRHAGTTALRALAAATFRADFGPPSTVQTAQKLAGVPATGGGRPAVCALQHARLVGPHCACGGQ